MCVQVWCKSNAVMKKVEDDCEVHSSTSCLCFTVLAMHSWKWRTMTQLKSNRQVVGFMSLLFYLYVPTHT